MEVITTPSYVLPFFRLLLVCKKFDSLCSNLVLYPRKFNATKLLLHKTTITN